MLEALFTPKSVALLGASATPGKVGNAIAANLLGGGFAGEIVFVNPGHDEILGHPCLPDLVAHEGAIDLAVIAVPAPAVKGAAAQALRAGAAVIVVVTAGFKEVDEAGARLQEEITRMCRDAGARLLGPNCLGVINAHSGLNASFAHHMPLPGGISIVSQSGALLTALLDTMAERRQGLAKLISIGNKADLNEVDMFRSLADDPETTVIVAYLESITSGREFLAAAEEASDRKPIVVLKSGTSAAGARAATSHTGSLAGADVAYGAAFRRSGVIRAAGYDELYDCAIAFAMEPLPAGRRVAIITNAGGPGIMAADAMEQAGLTIAPLSGATTAALKQKLPRAAAVGNPIDVLGDAGPARYAEALAVAQDDPGVDAILVLLTPQAMTEPTETARAIAKELRGEKPVLGVFMGGEEVLPGRAELVARGLPDYGSPERAVRALEAMCDYADWRSRPPRIVSRFPINRRRVARIFAGQRRMERAYVGEARAKEALRAYDFVVPEGGLAATAEQAVDIAERVGYPVAMKIHSPDIVHKSDVQGVRLALRSGHEVRDAFDLMMLRIPMKLPDAFLEGVYVEQMCPKGREVILGMTRDPQFGPMLMFGLGGIFVEVLKDVTFHLAPITAQEALEMLSGTKSYALLTGARGQSGVDLPALASGLQHISQLVTDFPEITELDINPFIVREVGLDPIVADARLRIDLSAQGSPVDHG